MELERPFAGAGGFDAEAQREYAGRVFDRARNLASQLTNPFAVKGGEGWRGRLGEIAAPTLVIHGDDDPLFPLEHGRALAREIPGAELLVLEGVGHEYPPPRTWDTVVAAILRHTARALQRLLAAKHQRGRKVPDLLIAAAAEAHDLAVLHYDSDFDLIARVTGQTCDWVVPAGTID